MKELITVEAKGLDTLRASKLLDHLGIKGFELSTVEDHLIVFTLLNFDNAYRALAKFYGSPSNDSNASWATKRLTWSVPEVKGEVQLTQVSNLRPLLIFRQL